MTEVRVGTKLFSPSFPLKYWPPVPFKSKPRTTMSLRRTTADTLSFYTAISRYFSSSSSATTAELTYLNLEALSKVPKRSRSKAIKDAQNALTDYLFSVKSLPLSYVEQISKNSPISLSYIIGKVDYHPSVGFFNSFQRFLRYHPINEFEFFYESIGIDYSEVDGFLPAHKFFLSEDMKVFNVACALCGFGFPWNKLGVLYKDEVSIFSRDPFELNRSLQKYVDLGFYNRALCGICLGFPYVLGRHCELSDEIDALFDDLKRVFIDFGLGNDLECDVDAWCDVCRKIKLFYDLGCEKGKMGELMGRSKHIFVEHSEDLMVQKIEYFCRLDVRKDEIGLLLLSKPEFFKFDLESPKFSVLGFLKHFGLEGEQLMYITAKYPYVLGRNRLTNLPHVMKSLDLNGWFFEKLKYGDHQLLNSYIIESPDEDLDKDYVDYLVKIKLSRTPFHSQSKLEFMHRMGYGENKLTIKILKNIHGRSSELKDRFDCLLLYGIPLSKLCKMVSKSPKLLNQSPEFLVQKVKFLCEDMGLSLNDLYIFPAYLTFNLEKRIKPRYRFHLWLKESGLCGTDYTVSSIVAASKKAFVDRIYTIHPAVLKKWLEEFSNKDDL